MSIEILKNGPDDKEETRIEWADGTTWTFLMTPAEKAISAIIFDMYIQAGEPFGKSPNEAISWAREGGLW